MAGRFRHRPAELDEWGPIMDTHNGVLEALHADLRVRCAELEAALATARAERNSAVQGTAAAVRDLVARVAAAEAVLAEYGDAGDVGALAERLRAVIRGQAHAETGDPLTCSDLGHITAEPCDHQDHAEARPC